MVSNARLDLPLPLGPVTTVSFPSGRSRSITLRLFWRAPRISIQPHSDGAATYSFLTAFEPTRDNSRYWRASQIWASCPTGWKPMSRSTLRVARAALLTLLGRRRLTNRKTSRARRAPFPIPHDQCRGSRPRIYALHRVRQDRDHAGWVASQSAI